MGHSDTNPRTALETAVLYALQETGNMSVGDDLGAVRQRLLGAIDEFVEQTLRGDARPREYKPLSDAALAALHARAERDLASPGHMVVACEEMLALVVLVRRMRRLLGVAVADEHAPTARNATVTPLRRREHALPGKSVVGNMRWCCDCQGYLPLTEFHKNAQTYCRVHTNQRASNKRFAPRPETMIQPVSLDAALKQKEG